MALDPIVASMLEAAKASGRPPFSQCTPDSARAMLAGLRPAYGTGPAIARVEEVSIPTRHGSIAGRLYVDRPEPKGLVVYLHGGGWVFGTLEDFEPAGRLLAQRSGCAILMPDYRLAPETRFPGGVEDSIDAILWAAGRTVELVGRRVPLAVAGDSAGGNLAAVAAAELRGRVDLAHQALIYPVTDCDFDRPSYVDPANAGVITRTDMMWFFDHYLGGGDAADPRVSPLRRGDLAGLPPTHVVLAGYDVLRSDGEAYADALEAAGIQTTRALYATLPHGFVRFFNLVPAARAAVIEIADMMGSACSLAAPESPAPPARVAASATTL